MTSLLEARGISKRFPIQGHSLSRTVGWVEALSGVSLAIGPGETVGLVGESGCGKSTLAKILAQLLAPTSGEVLFQGQKLSSAGGIRRLAFRRSVQMVFQDTAACFDPRMTVAQAIAEPMVIHRTARGAALRQEVSRLLQEVGLDPALGQRLPMGLSGGQRQRAAIARALALKPELLVCDEPVSSLDLSVQAQILSLLQDLQTTRGLSIFIISHNLATLGALARRILVMDRGRLVEEGTNPEIFHRPQHPATAALVKLALPKL
ncbi:MAG: ABC transporter ATP-binding protein [Candidatus Omnitrophica bacterium]|nr:ABC transporter ATP-binding protein [Candidatus Omnitrophota bacterium]